MKIPYLEISGEITNDTVVGFREQYSEVLDWYKKKVKKESIEEGSKINLFINSSGGSVDDAFAIHDIIQKGVDVDSDFGKETKLNIVTYASGCVQSAAMIIYLASVHRRAYNNSFFMIHDIQLSVDSMDTYVLQNYVTFVESQREKWNQMFVEQCQWQKHELKDLISRAGGEFYFDRNRALQLKVVNYI